MLKCRKIKTKHRHPTGELQQITMNLMVSLPRILEGYETWIIVDRLTKSVHLIPIKVTYSVEYLAELDYIEPFNYQFRWDFCFTSYF